ncbi:helix-turn-helix transcriptional regulator [Actinoplanes siamensis]|uniref:Helix-turn-helix domain-containing protein n=1 Tax=Actinoplanes siamensis TaxID=1223317 RepID=A0A919TLQ9_9ACTN|nr:helix-turn-helix domain-containing protein [Actinoplanes siamensis]GIF06355.1 hypothetical protein Asi03nite_38930 [Actinoplanes siamensis]
MGTRRRLYTTGDIADRLGVSRQRAYVLANRHGFPEPFDDLPGGSVWLVEDVEAWIRANRETRAQDPGER